MVIILNNSGEKLAEPSELEPWLYLTEVVSDKSGYVFLSRVTDRIEGSVMSTIFMSFISDPNVKRSLRLGLAEREA